MVSSWEGVKMIHLFICLSFFQISWRNKKLQAKKWQISYWHRSATGFLLIHKYPDFSSLKTDSIILLLTWSPLHVYSLSAPKGELPKITPSRRKVDHKFKSLMSITDLNLVNNWSLIKGSKLLSSGLCWSFTISLWVATTLLKRSSRMYLFLRGAEPAAYQSILYSSDSQLLTHY